MRIMVHDIIGRESGGFRISFSSPIRDGQAVWMGQEPERGIWLDVELEVPIPLTWGAEITLSGENRSVIRQWEKEIVITGLLEAADEDQVAAVRVGFCCWSKQEDLRRLWVPGWRSGSHCFIYIRFCSDDQTGGLFCYFPETAKENKSIANRRCQAAERK